MADYNTEESEENSAPARTGANRMMTDRGFGSYKNSINIKDYKLPITTAEQAAQRTKANGQ